MLRCKSWSARNEFLQLHVGSQNCVDCQILLQELCPTQVWAVSISSLGLFQVPHWKALRCYCYRKVLYVVIMKWNCYSHTECIIHVLVSRGLLSTSIAEAGEKSVVGSDDGIVTIIVHLNWWHCTSSLVHWQPAVENVFILIIFYVGWNMNQNGEIWNFLNWSRFPFKTSHSIPEGLEQI